MVALVDYPTFSESPFFFDRRNLHIPQDEGAHVNVGTGHGLFLNTI